jgi:hypothetical protein
MTDNARLRNNDDKSRYPYNQVTQTLGGHEIHFNSTPGYESYRLLQPSGTFVNVDKDGKKTQLVTNHEYHLTSNGSTLTVEGARDTMVYGGSRTTDISGSHVEYGSDLTVGGHSGAIYAFGGSTLHHSTLQSEHTSAGHFTYHDGSDGSDGYNYSHSSEDRMEMIGGSVYRMIGGEYGVYVSDGNHDTHVSGKYRAFSGGDMLIKTDSKMSSSSGGDYEVNSSGKVTITASNGIRLVVGESYVDISSSGITISSSATNLHGNPLNVNGGGVVVPRFTVY